MKTVFEEYQEVCNKIGKQINEKLNQAADLIIEANQMAKDNFKVDSLQPYGSSEIKINGLKIEDSNESYYINDVVDVSILKDSLSECGWNTSSMSC